jgi:hypothetical protein
MGSSVDGISTTAEFALARIAGTPAGIEGISMFIVPCYLLDAERWPSAAEDVRLAGVIREMGLYCGTTSTIISFGKAGGAVAERIRAPHQVP